MPASLWDTLLGAAKPNTGIPVDNGARAVRDPNVMFREWQAANPEIASQYTPERWLTEIHQPSIEAFESQQRKDTYRYPTVDVGSVPRDVPRTPDFLYRGREQAR